MSQRPKLSALRDSKKNAGQLNPFEFRKNLFMLTHERHAHNQRSMFDSENGNPNWTALSAREAYMALGDFAMQECRRDGNRISGMGGVPQKHGIASRFYKYLQDNRMQPGVALLTEIYKTCIRYYATDAEELIFELAEGVAGNQNPYPVRMLRNGERIVREFLIQELCGGQNPSKGNYDLFAVEGETAAASYITNSLATNRLLRPGDRIAIAVPVFTPYFKTPQLEKFGFDVTYVYASATDGEGNPNYQYPDSELDKLGDPAVKAFYIMDPANPASVVMEARSREYLAGVVNRRNPNLILITDNSYAPFAAGFRSFMSILPRNTITIFSFSKYFGCAGWCIGTVALHDDNVIDEMIAALPRTDAEQLDRLYGDIAENHNSLKFIDRMVADSREVTLNHTAGLSVPQQTLMTVMAGFALDDDSKGGAYKNDCVALLEKRHDLFLEGMGATPVRDPHRIDYYCTVDIEKWAEERYGTGFFGWLEMNFDPADIVYRIAEEYAVAFLCGKNHGWPEWSVRISLASLDTNEYKKLGAMLVNVLEDYADAWKCDSESA